MRKTKDSGASGRNAKQLRARILELEKANERYRALVDGISEGLWRTALTKPLRVEIPIEEQIQHIYTYSFIAECNDAMAHMYGFSCARDLVGKHRSEFFLKNDPLNVQYISDYISSGYRQVNGETHEVDKDGNEKYFLNNKVGIVENGFFLGTWGIQQDITARKNAEKNLRTAYEELELRVQERTAELKRANRALLEEIAERKRAQEALSHLLQLEQAAELKYRTLVEKVPGIVYSSDFGPEGKFHYLSPQLESILGYTIEEWLQSPRFWIDSIHPDDRERVLAEEAQSQRTGQALLSEYRLRARDGKYVWLRDQATVILDPSGGPPHLQGVMHNITQHKHAEIRNAAFSALGEKLNTAKNPEEAARIVVDVADQLVGWDSCLFDLYLDEEDTVKPVLVIDTIDGIRRDVPPTHGGAPTAAARQAIDQGAFLLSGTNPESHNLTPFGDISRRSASRIFVPIRSGKKVIGMFSIQSYTENAYGRIELEIFRALADYCGGALDRLRAEEQLRQSEERFAKAFQSNPAAITLSRPSGKFMDVNSAFELMTGYSRAELIGRNVLEVGLYLNPGDREKNLKRLEEDKTIHNVDIPIITKSGEIRRILGHYELIELSGEKCLLGMFEDITERLRAEERLSQLASIVESSHDSIIGIDIEGRVLSWNSAAEKLYQQSSDEVVGQPIALLFSPEYHIQLRNILARVKQGESVRDFETTRLDRQGRLLNLSLTFSPIKTVKGIIVGASLIVRDVTQFKELQQQVVQTQKIETIGQLAGGVAHDFNNILMAIRGYCELLELKTEPEDARGKDIREIMKAADQGAALTRQLLAFSRKQVMVPKILDLNHVLNQMADMVRRLIGENIELSMDRDPELSRIKADPGQVEQVILNLAVNAGDAMPSGGLLQMKTSNAIIDEDFARHNPGAVPGNYVLLRIADTGHGMDPETMSHIFEPFFTTKQKGRGTGLGLSTVYGIVKQTGGYIGVQSRRGAGTTFEVYFPSIQETSIVHNTPLPFRPVQYNHTILLVDDNEPVRTALTELLGTQGFIVLPASDGKEAEKIAREHRGKIHLLITDVVMPKMSGRELAKTLSSLVPDLKVLFISGYPDELVNSSDTDLIFVQKPVTLEALLSRINDLLSV